MDCNPPGFSVHAIFQTRILQWVAMPSSRESSQPRDQNRVSCIAGGFVTAEASREAHWKIHPLPIELIYMHYIQEMSSMRKVQCFGYSLPLGLTTQWGNDDNTWQNWARAMGHRLNTRGKEGRTQESFMEELSFKLNYEDGYSFSKQMVEGEAGISRGRSHTDREILGKFGSREW